MSRTPRDSTSHVAGLAGGLLVHDAAAPARLLLRGDDLALPLGGSKFSTLSLSLLPRGHLLLREEDAAADDGVVLDERELVRRLDRVLARRVEEARAGLAHEACRGRRGGDGEKFACGRPKSEHSSGATPCLYIYAARRRRMRPRDAGARCTSSLVRALAQATAGGRAGASRLLRSLRSLRSGHGTDMAAAPDDAAVEQCFLVCVLR